MVDTALTWDTLDSNVREFYRIEKELQFFFLSIAWFPTSKYSIKFELISIAVFPPNYEFYIAIQQKFDFGGLWFVVEGMFKRTERALIEENIELWVLKGMGCCFNAYETGEVIESDVSLFDSLWVESSLIDHDYSRTVIRE